MSAASPTELHFEHGTLVAPTLPDDGSLRAHFVHDPRANVFRAPAWKYREVALHLHRSGLAWTDRARAFEPLDLPLREAITPFPYQQAALDAWLGAGARGTVVLPTGAGKTILAVLAIARTRRPTLVVVPTLSLLAQWREILAKFLPVEIGAIGGGESERRDVTVTTYDSAALHTEFHGNRFGLIVFDEVHHLPGPTYRFIAEGAIAPFRLGLTATLERQDGGERVVESVVGPVVHRVEIDALEGSFLAPYDLRTVDVPLSPEEQARYDAARGIYRAFLKSSRIVISSPDGWRRFLMLTQQSEEGRRAFAAYREQRKIALAADTKHAAVWELVRRHRRDRTIVFTEDNETVHRLSRWLLAPAITHLTPAIERGRILGGFARGELPVILTSKVLNEGVDVPEANVGIVLSGSGSVREHVQRLGRILRRREGKRAVLYEVRSEGTAETGISDRRRQHRAYQKDKPADEAAPAPTPGGDESPC